MSSPAVSQQSHLLPTDEAARFLGISTRALQRKQRMYPLQFHVRKEHVGRRNVLVALYQRDELESYQDRRSRRIDAGHYERQLRGEGAPTEALAVQSSPVDQADGLSALALRLAHLGKLFPDQKPEPKLFLTIREAQEYSGLPELYLHQLAVEGKLGFNVGTKLRKKFRISRVELTRLAEQPRRR